MSGDIFAALLAPNLQSVRRFVHSRLRASDHAEDILQQTLLRAYAGRDQLRARSKFKSWLCSIALNEIRMFFRSDRPTMSLQELPDFQDHAPSPLATVEWGERVEWLQAGMAKLSERDRVTIRLRDFDGLSLAETATALESSESAAKSAHFRARRRLAYAIRGARGGMAAKPRRAVSTWHRRVPDSTSEKRTGK